MRKSSGGEVTDVEDAILSRYSSQRQLRLGLVLSVRLLVGYQFFRSNGFRILKDF